MSEEAQDARKVIALDMPNVTRPTVDFQLVLARAGILRAVALIVGATIAHGRAAWITVHYFTLFSGFATSRRKPSSSGSLLSGMKASASISSNA
jgi:hypothetical protein